MKFNITTHTIIKNEDRWIWYAINSVLPYVDKMLIYDTGSTDKTLKILSTIKSKKIHLEQHLAANRKSLVSLRQKQLGQTTTDWFMLLDGDEIWPETSLKSLLNARKQASSKTWAFFTRTRNAVGDIYHYLPESKGKYKIKDQTGHLNIRLMKNLQGLKVNGSYPLEAYTINHKAIQNYPNHLKFVDTWYLHTTHLPRSTNRQAEAEVIDRNQKRKFRLGKKMGRSDLPKILFSPRPEIIPAPISNRWLHLI